MGHFKNTHNYSEKYMIRFLTHPDKVSMENMTLKTLVLDTAFQTVSHLTKL